MYAAGLLRFVFVFGCILIISVVFMWLPCLCDSGLFVVGFDFCGWVFTETCDDLLCCV